MQNRPYVAVTMPDGETYRIPDCLFHWPDHVYVVRTDCVRAEIVDLIADCEDDAAGYDVDAIADELVCSLKSYSADGRQLGDVTYFVPSDMGVWDVIQRHARA